MTERQQQPRGEMTHELKSDPEIFQEHYDGIKPWDLRPCTDRDFRANDTNHYREFDRPTQEYSGRQILARIIKVRFGPFYCVPEGWAMLYLDPAMIRYDQAAFDERLEEERAARQVKDS